LSFALVFKSQVCEEEEEEEEEEKRQADRQTGSRIVNQQGLG